MLAGELAYGGGYSLGYDSNITRVPNDAIAEWTQTLFGGFGYQERTVDLDMRLLAQAERRDYLRNTYADEKAYYVNGAASWMILPQRFVWTVEDYASQVPISLTTVDTPNNRTNANTFNTGPDFSFHVTPLDTAAAGARYGRLDIEGPGDNERYSGYARWLHQTSPQASLSLNYLATRVAFQDPSFINYLLQAWFLRYEVRPSPSGMIIEVGTTRIIQEKLESPPPGRYGRFALQYQLTPEASLNASLESQYSDTAIDLLGGVTSAARPPAPPSTISATAVTGPYYGKRGDAGFDYRGGRFQFTARGYGRSVDYLRSDQSFDERNGRVEGTWLFGATRVRAYADYLKRTFRDFFEEDTLRTGSISIGYRLNRIMGISLEAARLEAVSTLPQNNYVDRRAVVALSFSTGPLYPASSRR